MSARRALMLAVAAFAMFGARRPPPPDLGELAVNRDDPTIDARITGVPARLAMSLTARDAIELSPALAPRVDAAWERGDREDVGRTRIRTRIAAGLVEWGGITEPMPFVTHDLPCCAGHDGEVQPLLTPWSTVRLGRADKLAERRFDASFTPEIGLFVKERTPAGEVWVTLDPNADRTTATASAAAILADAFGGRQTGDGYRVGIAFGITRQVRDMVFASPVTLLGLPVPRIAVRYADFAGRTMLPQDASPDDAITVRKKGPPPQRERPFVTLGRDVLGRCPTIAVYRAGPTIGLACR